MDASDAHHTDAGQRDAQPDAGLPADGGMPGCAGDGGGDAGGCQPGSTVPGWTSVVSMEDSTVTTMAAFAPNDIWMQTSSSIYRFDGVTETRFLAYESNTLWGNASNNVWIAGGTVRQWDGTTWTDRTPQIANLLVSHLFGFGANDVWLIGAARSTMVLHWDGQQWTDRTPPATFQPIKLWGTSSSDLWAGGAVSESPGVGLAFMHWNGTSWTASGDPGDSQHKSRQPGPMWGNAANDVWSIVQPSDAYSAGYEVWHFDGTAWAPFSTFPVGVLIGSVSRWAANDVWATASVMGDPFPEAAVVHFDGARWSLERTGEYGYLRNLGAVGPGELWAPTADTRHARLAHRHLVPCGTMGPGNMTGGGFELVTTGPGPMVMTATDQLWGLVGGTVSRLAGTAWVPSFTDPTGLLQYGLLVASGSDDLWAAYRTIEVFDGATWTDRTPPVPPAPSALYSLSAAWTGGPDDFWGALEIDDGTGPASHPVLHWDGSTWTAFALPAVPNFTFQHAGAIWGSGPRDVWLFTLLAADPPSISYVSAFYHWDGSSWTLGNDPSSADAAGTRTVAAAWGAGPNDVWAGAMDSQLGLFTWHFDGANWSVVDRVPGVAVGRSDSVWGSEASDVWVAAPGGTLRHFDGSTWSTVDPGADAVYGVTGSGQSDLWVRGTFYNPALLHLRR